MPIHHVCIAAVLPHERRDLPHDSASRAGGNSNARRETSAVRLSVSQQHTRRSTGTGSSMVARFRCGISYAQQCTIRIHSGIRTTMVQSGCVPTPGLKVNLLAWIGPQHDRSLEGGSAETAADRPTGDGKIKANWRLRPSAKAKRLSARWFWYLTCEVLSSRARCVKPKCASLSTL